MILTCFLIVIGFVFLIVGADLLVDGSRNIARKFHIPEIIIGLTVVSIGTSMPELFVSITSALENHSDMAIGNVIGSNITNMLLILGLAAMIKPVFFQKETRLIELPLCLFLTILFAVLANIGADITRVDAMILLVLFLGFIIYTIYMGKKGEEFDKDDEIHEVAVKNKESSVFKSIFFVIAGIIGLKIGGDLVVNNSILVANNFGVSEKIISLTIIAIGTSLPELVTSVTAAIKGDSDIAIGNIVGSSIFNLLLIIGISALIKPIEYNLDYNLDLVFLVIATIVLAVFPLIPPKNQMTRRNGAIYFIMYLFYMLVLFVR